MNLEVLGILHLVFSMWFSARVMVALPYVFEVYVDRMAHEGDEIALALQSAGVAFQVLAVVVTWVIISLAGLLGFWLLIAASEGRRFFRFYTKAENDHQVNELLERAHDRRGQK